MTPTQNYRLELIARLKRTTDDLLWAVNGLAPAHQVYSPADEEWSIHEHVAHLRDMEQHVYLPLLRWATVPDMLDPLDYSRRDWHEHRYRTDEPLQRLMDEILRMRDEELMIFREIDDATWTRWRDETRWGPLTCEWLAELMYRHVLDHLQGVMALRQDIHLESRRPRLAGAVRR
jgi:hypothetical protein